MKINKPYMKRGEWEFLISHLEPTHTMLEYGSGNSTIHLSPLVKNLYSIEHDRIWFEKVKTMSSNLNNVELHLVENDLPRTIPTKLEEFKTYINWIKNKNLIFNRVLIDGRARQWCAESILDKLTEDHIVFLHDYNLKERPQYLYVENFYKIIDRHHTMVAMRRR